MQRFKMQLKSPLRLSLLLWLGYLLRLVRRRNRGVMLSTI
jgi:hypothetical protein